MERGRVAGAGIVSTIFCMDGFSVITMSAYLVGRPGPLPSSPHVLRACAYSLLAATVVSQCSLSGCSSPPAADRADFESPHPSARIFAAERAVIAGDASAIPHLIEGLRSDDPAVRFTSIHALERLTARTYDYRYFDTPPRRQEAIHRWEQAYESGELNPLAAAVETKPTIPE